VRLAASVLVLVLTALVASGVASGTTPCEQQVLRDWGDNGRIDGVYPLPCYQAAIDELPMDVRDYTDAAEVIERALTAALRSAPDVADDAEDGDVRALAGPAPVGSTASQAPVALVLVGALGAAGLAAAGLGYAVHRRRGTTGDQPPGG
jgi:hypothetical protein